MQTPRPSRIVQGRYQLLEEQMRCRFSTLYRGIDQVTRAPVVLRRLHTPLVPPESRELAKEQFQKEGRLLKRLVHRNLPRVLDAVESEGEFYIVMEAFEGNPLDYVAGHLSGRPSEPLLCRWMDQIAAALEYLHTQDPPVIYRDLRPQTIVMTPSAVIKLVDFGLARMVEDMDRDRTAFRGRGATNYAAPEQFGSSPSSPSMDLYSLGATFYNLATGKVPPAAWDRSFSAIGLSEIRADNPAVSALLEQLIFGLMALTPADRPASATVVRQEIARISPGSVAAETQDVEVIPSDEAPTIKPVRGEGPPPSIKKPASASPTPVRMRVPGPTPEAPPQDSPTPPRVAGPVPQKPPVPPATPTSVPEPAQLPGPAPTAPASAGSLPSAAAAGFSVPRTRPPAPRAGPFVGAPRDYEPSTMSSLPGIPASPRPPSERPTRLAGTRPHPVDAGPARPEQQVPFLDLKRIPLERETARSLPEALCRRIQGVCIGRPSANDLSVAVVSPDASTVQHVASVVGPSCRLTLLRTDEESFNLAMEYAYGLPASEPPPGWLDWLTGRKDATAPTPAPAPTHGDALSESHGQALAALRQFVQAPLSKAPDVAVDATANELRMRFLSEGQLYVLRVVTYPSSVAALTPGALQAAAQAVVVGRVAALFRRTVPVEGGTDDHVVAEIEVARVEKEFAGLAAGNRIFAQYRSIGQRSPQWRGSPLQLEPLVEGAHVRLFLRLSPADLTWYLLEPQGWMNAG